ncbi:MAG: hypothetical protein A3J83_00030 [Elusimicrobia bacterium RIFOXYA2_FULL_40_6]|nr:MAG: hypothetical protein A3J83_00030 [Elusimicrobia bacterium RIFOXYA2_FULL_40_6]
MKNKLFLLLLCLLALSPQLFASSLLDQSIGTKAMAMGECFTGLSNDINAIFWNPAGIYNVKNRELNMLMFNSFSDAAVNELSFGTKLAGRGGAIGIGYCSFDAGSFEWISDSNNDGVDETRTLKALTETMTVLGYSNKIAKLSREAQVLVGVNLKMLSSKLVEQYPASANAIDVGLLYQYKKEKEFSVGIAVQNLGSGLKYIEYADPLPMKIRLGFASDIINTYKYSFKILGDAVNSVKDKRTDISAGAEYTFAKLLSLRAGYKMGDITKMTAGFGVNVKKIYTINYSMEILGDLETLNQFSFGLVF